MRKKLFGTLLACFLFLVLSFPVNAKSTISPSQIPGVGIPSINTAACSGTTVIKKNSIWHSGSLVKDVYIQYDAILAIDGDATIYGDVYVFGTLDVTGDLTITGNLYCLRSPLGNAGNYNFGIVKSSGLITVNNSLIMYDYYLLNGIPELNHNFTDWMISIKPSCKSFGLKTRACYDCSEAESSVLPKSDCEYGSWQNVTIPTCNKEGYQQSVCKICGNIKTRTLPVTNHAYQTWVTTKKPTIFKSGLKQRVCIHCGNIQKDTLNKLKAKVTLKYKTLKLKKGATSSKLKLKSKSKGDKVVSWTSSKKKVATVNKKTGKIAAKKRGTTYVTVKMKSGATAKCKVIIR